jgi:hypothetical protein
MQAMLHYSFQLLCVSATKLEKPSERKRHRIVFLVVSAGILSLVAAYALTFSAVLGQCDKDSKLVARRLPEGHRVAFAGRKAINIADRMFLIFHKVSFLLVFVSVIWILV